MTQYHLSYEQKITYAIENNLEMSDDYREKMLEWLHRALADAYYQGQVNQVLAALPELRD